MFVPPSGQASGDSDFPFKFKDFQASEELLFLWHLSDKMRG